MEADSVSRVVVDSWVDVRSGSRLEFFLRCLDCGEILSEVYGDERECAGIAGGITHECKGKVLGAS